MRRRAEGVASSRIALLGAASPAAASTHTGQLRDRRLLRRPDDRRHHDDPDEALHGTPHGGEVFHAFDAQAAASYPTDEAWGQLIYPVCDPVFETYTGTAVEDRTDIDYLFLVPTSDRWAGGDRRVTCFIRSLDGEPAPPFVPGVLLTFDARRHTGSTGSLPSRAEGASTVRTSGETAEGGQWMQWVPVGLGRPPGIVAVIIVGGFILRDRLSSNAGDLKVGDCFDEPASGAEISDVQHHPCTEAPHGRGRLPRRDDRRQQRPTRPTTSSSQYVGDELPAGARRSYTATTFETETDARR